jgi:SAM-dependent methyltransferase
MGPAPAPRPDQPTDWDDPFGLLRRKWSEIPSGPSERQSAESLLDLPDEELLAFWQRARSSVSEGAQFSHRGWYHALYAPAFHGLHLLDVGCGLGIDGITFAQHGARVTFVDLTRASLELVRRLCRILRLEHTSFVHLETLDSLSRLDRGFDVVLAIGSLHHAPRSVIQPEARELIARLKPGGRWIQLAYPESRWIREGRVAFDRWGELTDGPGTPWAEWYELPKLLGLLEPARFDVVLCREFHDGNFIWFDLRLEGRDESSGGA